MDSVGAVSSAKLRDRALGDRALESCYLHRQAATSVPTQSVMQIAECGIKADDIIFSGVPRWDNLIKAEWPKLAGKELGPRGNLLGS